MAQGTLQQGSATYSIARQAIDLGFATLSDRQRFIYEQVLAPTLKSTQSFEFRSAPQSHPYPRNASASKLIATDLTAIGTTANKRDHRQLIHRKARPDALLCGQRLRKRVD